MICFFQTSIARSRSILNFFDVRSEQNNYILSSNGYSGGSHEWTIKILQCNDKRQEFGVISNFATNITMNKYGLCDTASFGARAVYGYNSSNKSFYYASYNRDNTHRCNKNLSNLDIHETGWKSGDLIKINLNLIKGKIRFFLNGKQVRKTISVERGVTFYPIIVFSGDCKYDIIHSSCSDK